MAFHDRPNISSLASYSVLSASSYSSVSSASFGIVGLTARNGRVIGVLMMGEV